MNKDDIWFERAKMDKVRGEKMREFLADYDARVYEPAKTKLVEDCARITGHKFNFNGNGLIDDVRFLVCQYCGINKIERD